MHLVALNEVLGLLQTFEGRRDVRPDVFVDVPAEVFIHNHKEQRVEIVP